MYCNDILLLWLITWTTKNKFRQHYAGHKNDLQTPETYHEADPIDCHFPCSHRREGSQRATRSILGGKPDSDA